MAIFELLKEVANQHLMDQAGLWGLLALIPVLLVYLIRPRPKTQTVPALMFLIKESAKSDKTSFLRRFIRDPLLILQILILVAFAIALAKPFMTVTEDIFVEKTAIVLDASASSQTTIDGESRFERGLEIAKENLGSKNAIIIISSVPELLLESGDAAKAREELDTVKPRDTPTNIFDAMIFAGNYVKEKDKIVVISDFIETGSQKDFNAAKNILESRGLIVEMANTKDLESRKAKNIGIIDIDIKEDQTSVQIKNFNDQNETIMLDVEGANLTVKELTIEAKAIEVVSFRPRLRSRNSQ